MASNLSPDLRDAIADAVDYIHLPIPLTTDNNTGDQMEAFVTIEQERSLSVFKSFSTKMVADLSITFFGLKYDYHKVVYTDGHIFKHSEETVPETRATKLERLLSRISLKKIGGTTSEGETKENSSGPYQFSSHQAILKRTIRESSSKMMIVAKESHRRKSLRFSPLSYASVSCEVPGNVNEEMNTTNSEGNGNGAKGITNGSTPKRSNWKWPCKIQFHIKNTDRDIGEGTSLPSDEVESREDNGSLNSSIIPASNVDEADNALSNVIGSIITEDSSPVSSSEDDDTAHTV